MRLENPYLAEECVIKRTKRQTPDTYTYFISYPRGSKKLRTPFKPGQFIMISVLGVGEAPFSFSAWDYEEAIFETTIRTVGNVTSTLMRRGEGQRVWVRGPYGRGWPMEEARGRDILIVAGGIGIAPLKPVIELVAKNRRSYGSLEILYGAKTPDDLLFADEFNSWREIPDADLLLTVDSVPNGMEWDQNVGVVTTLFDKMRTEPNDSIVMTCGPEIMMKFVAKGLLAMGFQPKDLYLSLERRMKCGIAQCGHCQIGPKFVCRDGPVFPYSELRGLPDLLV
ncbi:MAG: FAD/NAD(P)-binding protein [Candidatus Bathyarchaeia archaeon]